MLLDLEVMPRLKAQLRSLQDELEAEKAKAPPHPPPNTFFFFFSGGGGGSCFRFVRVLGFRVLGF